MLFVLSSTHDPMSGCCKNLAYLLYLLNRRENYYYFMFTLIPYFNKEGINTINNAGIRNITWNIVSEKKRERNDYMSKGVPSWNSTIIKLEQQGSLFFSPVAVTRKQAALFHTARDSLSGFQSHFGYWHSSHQEGRSLEVQGQEYVRDKLLTSPLSTLCQQEFERTLTPRCKSSDRKWEVSS